LQEGCDHVISAGERERGGGDLVRENEQLWH